MKRTATSDLVLPTLRSPARKRRDEFKGGSRCFRSGLHGTERMLNALLLIATIMLFPHASNAALSEARVLADEIITTTTPSNNGSNPMWSVGAPLVVREGGDVWASISIHDPDEPPMCNTHWELWRKSESNPWERIRRGAAASEREPCPLFMPTPGRLLLSVHPKILEKELQSNGEHSWFTQPAIAQFDPRHMDAETGLLQPEFTGRPEFNQHSYRSVAVDPANGAFLLMVIDRENRFNVTWHDSSGVWHPVKEPEFPIRSLYPNIVLRGIEAHVFAIGDIKEPVREWRDEKFRILNREWDYAFRRVFYAWSSDLGGGSFETPLEIDSVDDTAGWAFNLDMAVTPDGKTHLLWVRQNIHYAFMRDRFFPGTPIVEEVRHAVVKNGRILSTETLSRSEVDGGTRARRSTSGRFHQLPDGRLLAVFLSEQGDTDGKPLPEMRIQELDPEARASSPPVRVAIENPPSPGWFFTNTPRGGSRVDNNLDILTTETKDGIISLRYIHVLVAD